jgi:hypothetical protein
VDKLNDAGEVVSRSPTELAPRSFVDVNPVDAGEHRPSAADVRFLVVGHTPLHNRRCIRAELLQVIAGEGCRRAHDVATEPDRGCLLQREKMRVDDVLDVRPPVQKLVHLNVAVVVGLPRLLPVVRFRKEARRSEDETRQAEVAVEHLAQILGSELGDAVDVLGTGTTSSVIQAAGAPGDGVRARPNALVVLVKTRAPTPAAVASSSRLRKLDQTLLPICA